MTMAEIEPVTLSSVFGEPLPMNLVRASIEKLSDLFPNPKRRLLAMEAVRNMFLNQKHIDDFLNPEIEKLLEEDQNGQLNEAIVLLTVGYTASRNQEGKDLWDSEIERLQTVVQAATQAIRT